MTRPKGTIGRAPATLSDLESLPAELLYRAADLESFSPEAASILRDAARDLDRYASLNDAIPERVELPESVRGAIERALSVVH